jgi:hypothetical protein
MSPVGSNFAAEPRSRPSHRRTATVIGDRTHDHVRGRRAQGLPRFHHQGQRHRPCCRRGHRRGVHCCRQRRRRRFDHSADRRDLRRARSQRGGHLHYQRSPLFDRPHPDCNDQLPASCGGRLLRAHRADERVPGVAGQVCRGRAASSPRGSAGIAGDPRPDPGPPERDPTTGQLGSGDSTPEG